MLCLQAKHVRATWYSNCQRRGLGTGWYHNYQGRGFWTRLVLDCVIVTFGAVLGSCSTVVQHNFLTGNRSYKDKQSPSVTSPLSSGLISVAK